MRIGAAIAWAVAAAATVYSQDASRYDIAYASGGQIFVMPADGSRPARVIAQGAGAVSSSFTISPLLPQRR